MFCALHAVAAFGVLLIVCSLVRADAVLLRVRFLFLRFFLCRSLSCKLKIRIFWPIFSRSSPAQSPSPVFFSPFSLYRQARSPRQFSPPLELAAVCMCSTLLSLSAAPALEKSPPGFSPSFIRLLALQRCKPKPPRVVSPCMRPARERE